MTIEDEVRRATKLLETVMQAAGLTRKDLDQRLGAGPGYVSQVLTGRMELKFRHILAILRALDVEPGVFFQTLYPESRPASDQAVMEEFLRRFQRLGFGGGSGGGLVPVPAPSPAQPAVDPQALEHLVRKAVLEALSERGPDQPDQAGTQTPMPEGDKPRRRRTTE